MSGCNCCEKPCEDCSCDKASSSSKVLIGYHNKTMVTSSESDTSKSKILFKNITATFDTNIDTDRSVFCFYIFGCPSVSQNGSVQNHGIGINPDEEDDIFKLCLLHFRNRTSKLIDDATDDEYSYPDYNSNISLVPCYVQNVILDKSVFNNSSFFVADPSIYANNDPISFTLTKKELPIPSDLTKWFSFTESGGINDTINPTRLDIGYFGVCVIIKANTAQEDASKIIESLSIGDLCVKLIDRCKDCEFHADSLKTLSESAIYYGITPPYSELQPPPTIPFTLEHFDDDNDVIDYSRFTIDTSNPDFHNGDTYGSTVYYLFNETYNPVTEGGVGQFRFCIQGRFIKGSGISVYPVIYKNGLYKIINGSGAIRERRMFFPYTDHWYNAVVDVASDISLVIGESFQVGFAFVTQHGSYNNDTAEAHKIIMDIADMCVIIRPSEYTPDITCAPSNADEITLLDMSDASLDFVPIAPPGASITSTEVVLPGGYSLRDIRFTTTAFNGVIDIGTNGCYAVHFFKNYEITFDNETCSYVANDITKIICLTAPDISFISNTWTDNYSNIDIFGKVFARQNGNIYVLGGSSGPANEHNNTYNPLVGSLIGGSPADYIVSSARIDSTGVIYPNDNLILEDGAPPIEIGFGIGAGPNKQYPTFPQSNLYLDTAKLSHSTGAYPYWPYRPIFLHPNCNQSHCHGIDYFELEILGDLSCNNQIKNIPTAGTTIILQPGKQKIGNLIYTVGLSYYNTYFSNGYDVAVPGYIATCSIKWFDNTANFSYINLITTYIAHGFTNAGDRYYHCPQQETGCEGWTYLLEEVDFVGALGQTIHAICSATSTPIMGTKVILIPPKARLRAIFN